MLSIKVDALKSWTLNELTDNLMTNPELINFITFNNHRNNIRYRLFDEKKQLKTTVFSLLTE
jgi:hypothetical protein